MRSSNSRATAPRSVHVPAPHRAGHLVDIAERAPQRTVGNAHRPKIPDGRRCRAALVRRALDPCRARRRVTWQTGASAKRRGGGGRAMRSRVPPSRATPPPRHAWRQRAAASRRHATSRSSHKADKAPNPAPESEARHRLINDVSHSAALPALKDFHNFTTRCRRAHAARCVLNSVRRPPKDHLATSTRQ